MPRDGSIVRGVILVASVWLWLTVARVQRAAADDDVGNEDELRRTCTGPYDREGYCHHFGNCFDEEYGGDFGLAQNYTCTIENAYLGICCSQRSYSTGGSPFAEQNLARILPAIAVEGGSATNVSSPSASSGQDETRRLARQPRGCGMAAKSRTRLVGGRPADPAEWPWMAALLRQDAEQYCGGVLITDRHVLTAAHCVFRYKPRDIRVRLGEYDFTTASETRALDFAVTDLRVHRDFDYTTYEHDIAIAKIHRPTVFNNYIWPVCLPPVQLTFENRNAIVTGWGTQYYGGPTSTVLLEVSVPIWPQDKCERSFTQRITSRTMCAGAYEGGRDACQGDSGGPLLHQLGNGRWVNVGIVSWGIRCGEPGHPGIYTRVNSYLDWIFANAVF